MEKQLIHRALTALLLVVTLSGVRAADRLFTAEGLPTDEKFFPIAVWLQQPRHADRYRAAGINLYVGLWRGPTREQLDQLEAAGMPVICAQNAFALEHRDRAIIAGWMHGDEPDNAQSRGRGQGYGSPILPGKIIADYERMRAADSTRPVLLNLGQGVAWDNYIGRGVRRNHPEDYLEYVKGCDIASFDIYPVVHNAPEIAGRLEFVAHGVERLVGWAGPARPVWNCIECTSISHPPAKATPAQIRAEVWMALIRGSRGLVYFVHQFKPVERDAALLDDPEALAAVTAINHQVQELAPVLNSPSVSDGVTVTTAETDGSVIAMLKRKGGRTYLFAASLRNAATRATFGLKDASALRRAEVLGEDRTLSVEGGRFADEFAPYAVHLYELKAAGGK